MPKWQNACRALSTTCGGFLALSIFRLLSPSLPHHCHHLRHQHHSSKQDPLNHQCAKWVAKRNCQLKDQPETPTPIITDFSKRLYNGEDINWSTTDIYSIPGTEVIYKKKVTSLSPAHRSGRHQQPQLTALCPVPAPSIIQALPGLPAWRQGSDLPWPEHHHTSADTYSKNNNHDKSSSNESGSCNLPRAHIRSGIVPTAWPLPL